MLQPGQQFYFKADPKQTLFTIRAVSPFVEMIEVEETDGWCWIASIQLSNVPPTAYTNQGSLFSDV